jgi:cupin 2 domain-containing protein
VRMKIEKSNLFAHEPVRPLEEFMQTLLKTGGFRLERIVSNGSRTPEGDWYDQDTDEWVVVLKGKARLRFEHPDSEIELLPGDFVNIAAHRRHRVEWTDPREPTIWLAIHYP